MEQVKENEYECGHCHEVYEKGWSDEEAEKEAQDTFGKPSEEWVGGKVTVCDDCYQKMHPKDNPELVEETKNQI